jgi:hypothetical protein
MSALAVIRPDDWNFPLLVHVFGAMVLVGGLATALAFQVAGWRPERPDAAARLARWSFRSLLFVAFPAWWVMRIGAEWIYSRENWGSVSEEPTWIGIGYMTAEGGGLLLLIGIILAGIGTRRLARDGGGPNMLVRVSAVLVTIALVAYVIATWAMSGKPG